MKAVVFHGVGDIRIDSDIFPTGYFGADIAEIRDGDTVAVFGCGPVGQFAVLSAKLLGAGRVLAVDGHDDRLAIARRQGAEIINFNREHPVEAIKRLTGGSAPTGSSMPWASMPSGPRTDRPPRNPSS